MKALAVALAIIFVVAAIVAFTGSAHFAPALGFNGQPRHLHAVLYLVLALLSLIWLRFQK
jgi:hypothetical protein